MKIGKSLVELAEEVQRQADAKRDFIVSTKDMRIVTYEGGSEPRQTSQGFSYVTRQPVDGGVKLELGGSMGELLTIGQTAHDQIAQQAEIPTSYYRRMLAKQPELLARNINTWFAAEPENRMVRTLDGKARALLSDKFRPLDNFDLLEAALPAMQSSNLEIVSCEVTEKRLYVKAVDRSIQRHIPSGYRMGDGSHQFFRVPSGEIIPAMQFSNSEIGHGALSVTGGWLDNGCTNLAWSFRERGLRRTHVGARLDIGDELYRLLTTEAREATDRAIWLQFRDAVKAAISPEGFDALVETLTAAVSDRITADPVKVVEVTAKRFALSDTQRTSVLTHLIQGGELSRFGLANAITSAANDQADYETATELEVLGGKVIELPKHEWADISHAKAA